MSYIVAFFLLGCIEAFLLSVVWNSNHMLQKAVEERLRKLYGPYGMSKKWFTRIARAGFIGFAIFVVFLMLNCVYFFIVALVK